MLFQNTIAVENHHLVDVRLGSEYAFDDIEDDDDDLICVKVDQGKISHLFLDG